ncbi:MAG TPA: HEPN domain-containing protein [Gemmataceae bacterium]
MNERDFLALASRLAAGSAEAEWRTAVSRAYYAAFHAARRLLSELGFRVPRADRAHSYLFLRLQNCGEPAVQQAGIALTHLRQTRNHADYDLHRSFTQPSARDQVQISERILLSLDAARMDPVRTRITTAIRDYERNVLKDVTWQGP